MVGAPHIALNYTPIALSGDLPTARAYGRLHYVKHGLATRRIVPPVHQHYPRQLAEEDAVKRTIRTQLNVVIMMGLVLALTACVRPAPQDEDTVNFAATMAAQTAEAATSIPAIPTQPEGLVLPPTPTPLPIVGATSTPDPALAQPTLAPSFTLPTTHTVVVGETLASISAIYGVPVDQIQAANGITDPNVVLTPGQVLTIPAPGTVAVATPLPAPTGEQTYVVQPGDNLFRIGLNHGGYTAAELAAYNGIPNPTLIFPGQVIRFPPR